MHWSCPQFDVRNFCQFIRRTLMYVRTFVCSNAVRMRLWMYCKDSAAGLVEVYSGVNSQCVAHSYLHRQAHKLAAFHIQYSKIRLTVNAISRPITPPNQEHHLSPLLRPTTTEWYGRRARRNATSLAPPAPARQRVLCPSA
jgi:hypothetical protein